MSGPGRMEFSKILLIFASVMYVATWAVIVISIFRADETPWQLMEMLSWVYGAAVVCYCGKAAYENGSKIKSRGGETNEHSR